MATPIKWGSEFLVNTITTNNQLYPAISMLADGRFVSMWTDNSVTLGDNNGDAIHGQIFNADGSKSGAEFLVNTTTAGNQSFPEITSLANGKFVATWTSVNGGFENDVQAQIFNIDGSKSGAEFMVNHLNVGDQYDQNIAALSGGGFVVTFYSAEDGFIKLQVYDANGTETTPQWAFTPAFAATDPTVTGLTNGNFVIAWRTESAGKDVVHLEIFDAKTGLPVVVETSATQFHIADQTQPSITALADGRFVVAWTNEFNGNFDVHGQIFNANGTRSDSESTLDSTAHQVFSVDITGLADGRFVATYTEQGPSGDQSVLGQLFNTDGTKSGDEFLVATTTDGQHWLPQLTALADGRFAVAWIDTPFQGAGGDGSFSGIRAQIFDPRESGADIHGTGMNDDLVGTSFGDTMKGGGGADRLAGMDGDDLLQGNSGADTLIGGDGVDTASYASSTFGLTVNLETHTASGGDAQGDTLLSIENLTGSGQADTLTGDAGANLIEGGNGNDTIDGRAGDDTAVFSHSFNEYTVMDFGAKIVVVGPDGTDTLSNIEHLQFSNTTITPANLADGNPEFDTLYYLSRNGDVFNAGANALDHFNALGWHEGRDPNPYFDTSGYLAVNKDVAASGMNPLDHFHQTGWHEGRDPGADFDTTLYLIHNPDVAAAGIDPLAHYLQFGKAEGRAAYQAIGQNIAGGFDAEYYLFHNPDVAAAGVDPLAHFNANGWHEGRNPNAYFDTAGYLAHYGDVAAAGINPLQHYEMYGWMEGRDPSAGFDTLGYLAANPDVAAAHINPLDHFLQNGIYEGRQAVNDGLWH